MHMETLDWWSKVVLESSAYVIWLISKQTKNIKILPVKKNIHYYLIIVPISWLYNGSVHFPLFQLRSFSVLSSTPKYTYGSSALSSR